LKNSTPGSTILGNTVIYLIFLSTPWRKLWPSLWIYGYLWQSLFWRVYLCRWCMFMSPRTAQRWRAMCSIYSNYSSTSTTSKRKVALL